MRVRAYDFGLPEFWISTDGRAWTHPALRGSPPSRHVFGLTSGGPGFVAVGLGVADGLLVGGHGRIWTSPDGVSWRLVMDKPNVLFTAVTKGGPGLVAVGVDGNAGAVWTSSDGEHWKEVPDPKRVFAGANLRSVASGGSGLLAVGLESSTSSSPTPAIWSSRNASTWERVPANPAIFTDPQNPTPQNQALPRKVVVGARVAAVLSDAAFDGQPLLWTSSDGVHWTRPSWEAQQAGHLDDIIPWQGGFLAVGDEEGEAALWSSADGSSWQRQAGVPALGSGPGEVQALAPFKGGLLAAGSLSPLFGQPASVVWRWTPDSSQTAPPASRDPRDPRRFVLRPADLPAGYKLSEWGYSLGTSGRFVQALRKYAVATFGFSGRMDVSGMAIVAEGSASAHAAMLIAHTLYPPDTCEDETSETVPISPVPRIGQETRLFRVKTLLCGEGEYVVETGYALFWRQGRYIGNVFVGQSDSGQPGSPADTRASPEEQTMAFELAHKQRGYLGR